ncbi:hypothetical protein A3F06_02220 [candidate division TM6 bacterium RIFCSPHIGHO2_12_FULL_36_22]|nr:MAG: hypothetical protein A3F06_02220 [candidate division TM6 bacterium RIFCSPHIGHO2_12_FULL_36_22]
MTLINKYKKFLEEFDDKKQLQILFIIIGLVILSGGFLLYRYSSSVKSLKKQMVVLNQARKETQQLLSKNEVVQKQRDKVEAMLAKEKSFKLMEYFKTVLDQLKLNAHRASEKISINDTEGIRASGYEEVNLSAQLTNMNTKQVVNLLYEIEQNERVYIKKLEITHSKTNPVVDLNLTIGTLQKKAEAEGSR